MKTKKIITALLVGAIAVTATVSASATTLTNNSPDGSAEITAKIEGAGPGDVSYIITIPDKVDFGTLSQPEIDEDSYKYVGFNVVATELNNFSTRQAVSVHIKDSVSDDGQFYLTQKASASPFTIPYDVYERVIDDTNRTDYTPMNESGTHSEYGYHLCTFTSDSEGAVQDVTLALNQKKLYGQSLDTIAGDYSGTMVFHSTLTTLGG